MTELYLKTEKIIACSNPSHPIIIQLSLFCLHEAAECYFICLLWVTAQHSYLHFTRHWVTC